ncbi:hypothetical protein SCA6_017251 [Theobroma cacao]
MIVGMPASCRLEYFIPFAVYLLSSQNFILMWKVVSCRPWEWIIFRLYQEGEGRKNYNYCVALKKDPELE